MQRNTLLPLLAVLGTLIIAACGGQAPTKDLPDTDQTSRGSSICEFLDCGYEFSQAVQNKIDEHISENNLVPPDQGLATYVCGMYWRSTITAILLRQDISIALSKFVTASCGASCSYNTPPQGGITSCQSVAYAACINNAPPGFTYNGCHPSYVKLLRTDGVQFPQGHACATMMANQSGQSSDFWWCPGGNEQNTCDYLKNQPNDPTLVTNYVLSREFTWQLANDTARPYGITPNSVTSMFVMPYYSIQATAKYEFGGGDIVFDVTYANNVAPQDRPGVLVDLARSLVDKRETLPPFGEADAVAGVNNNAGEVFQLDCVEITEENNSFSITVTPE